MTKRFLLMMMALAATAWMPAGAAQAADPHGDASHSAAAADDHKPQALVPDPTDPKIQLQALWVVILFVVLLAVLYPTAWKQVLAGLKAREGRIRKDIADAEAARARADETLKTYTAQLQAAEDKVRDMINRATAEGEKIAASIKAHAQAEGEETKERAQRDIEAAKNQAITDIYQQTATLATSIAEKIIRKTLSPDDHRDLVNRSLEQVQSAQKN